MKGELKPWLDQDVSTELRRLLEAAKTQEPGVAAIRHVTAQLAVADLSSTSTSNLAFPTGTAAGSGVLASKLTLVGSSLVGALVAGIGLVGIQQSAVPAAVPAPAPSRVLEGPRTAVDLGVTNSETRGSNPASPNPATSDSTTSSHNGERRASQSLSATRQNWPAQQAGEAKELVATAPADPRAIVGSSAPATSVQTLAGTSSNPTSASHWSQGAYIDAARHAVDQGNLVEALRVLDRYDEQFPVRKFAPEALQLRVRANSLLGNRQAARSAAEILVRNYGSTPAGKDACEFLHK